MITEQLIHNTPNIKDFAIENPRTRMPFELEDITNSDWEYMIGGIKDTIVNDHEVEGYFENAFVSLTLDHTNTRINRSLIPNSNINRGLKALRNKRLSNYWPSYAQLRMMIYAIDESALEHEKLSSNDFEQMDFYLQYYRNHLHDYEESPMYFFNLTFAQKVLWPERFQPIDLTKDELEALQMRFADARGKGKYTAVAHILRNVRFVAPSHKNDFPLSNTDIVGIKDSLNVLRDKGRWNTFSMLALDMSMLFADDIQVKDGQLQLIKKTGLENSIPNIPEVRRF